MRRTLASLLSVAVALCLVLLTLSSLGLAPSRALAQGPGEGPDGLLARVARAAGRDPASLVIADEAPVTLIDGSTLLRVKVVDPASGDAAQVTFDGESVVDEAAVRAQAVSDWRSAHGAAEYQLVQALAVMGPDDVVDVALWLLADVAPLPKPERIYVPDPLDTSTEGPAEATAEAPGSFVLVGDKRVAVPLALAALPPDVVAALGAAALTPPGSGAAPQAEAVAEKPADDRSPATPDTLALVEEAQAQKALNDAHIRAQIAPVQKQALDQLAGAGMATRVTYASDIAPLVYLSGVTRREVEAMAFWPGMDTIYLATNGGGPSLGIARPTQNANLLEAYGHYTGLGVGVAVVEGQRMTTTNPYLSVAGVRDPAYAAQPHPTAVGGMIRSTHAGVRGLAPGVTLYSANGDDYATWAGTELAMDWGATQSSVQNNSHWMGTADVDAPQSPDRHLDYIVRNLYDLAVVASGNFNLANCQEAGSPANNYVMSPAKGYNVLSVGNYDDHDTLGWTGDTMDSCSSYNHTGRFKPEVAATGHGISSTIVSSPWVAATGSGTSYSSPMVTALAADLQQIAPALVFEPEATKAIIMATALHNIEGDDRLSRQDGVGGIDAAAAAVTAERGRWDDRAISSSTVWPITFTVFARQNERVRFATTWLSNPTASPYASDPLPVDLDVTAFRADGTTVVGFSNNSMTNMEIVDFTAPAAENYLIRVSRMGAWSGGSTWMGSAWYRGPHRISPETGYSDPKAAPMGTFLAVRPADWLYSGVWRAFGIRSASDTDHDLSLWTASFFDDPSTRSYVMGSTYVAGYSDFIVVDGNHRNSSTMEEYRVNYLGGGSSGYNVSRSATGYAFVAPGLYGPFTMQSTEVVKAFDVYYAAGATRRIAVIPGPSNANDLGVALFKSDSGNPATWVSRRSSGVVNRDAYTATTAVESFVFQNTGGADWLGLVVHGRNTAFSQFYVLVADYTVYLPLVTRSF